MIEPLKEVCVVKDKAGVTGLLFKVENEVLYYLQHLTCDLDNLLMIKVLFSAELDLERR
ncbi:TPA: hypothetical protein ACPIBI_004723 [Pseudomonas aeruginosa]|uniref:hypothetical protein n=1 Tax=Pseudomonas citronellolis TaxID=53408 RepID=UPI001A1E7DD3|nr:hypothetical protein [Pseudomonas citronellolis]MBH3547446.1 hypothetical protein [Pseudomonas aeruginosa]UUC47472.1 hypothetical protein NOX82_16265 [Pseudomonas citronellolis]HBN9703292.1 hypothetical protein [Pseudomonas aeruginosa]HBN9721840.1 hypothetical protein [Pseudomonas aeruginosa]HBN9767919.1 hypothetical protein [Pseudomonas aeruginosa]